MNISDAILQVSSLLNLLIAKSGGGTEQNGAILETEIRIREGASTFSIEGNQVGAISSYLGSNHSHFGRKVNANIRFANVETFKQNADGEWEREKKNVCYTMVNNMKFC